MMCGTPKCLINDWGEPLRVLCRACFEKEVAKAVAEERETIAKLVDGCPCAFDDIINCPHNHLGREETAAAIRARGGE